MKTCGRYIFPGILHQQKVTSKKLTWFLRNYREIRLYLLNKIERKHTFIQLTDSDQTLINF